jgi:FkbM family methyltransferase
VSLTETLKFIVNHPLNRGRKLTSIARFAKWQIGSRLVRDPIVYDWVNGTKFLVRRGEAGLTGNIYTGLHEFPDMGFLLHFLRPNDLFIDVGANAGSYTILASAAIGARGIAFEPIPETYGRLMENLHLNHLDDRVVALNKGVGAESATIQFTSDTDCTNHALAADELHASTVSVEVNTLDSALLGQSPMLMKIDVEGYETPVLMGGQQALRNESLRAVIMELNGSGDRYGLDESRILAMMLDSGFGTYSYDPLTRALVNLEGKNLASGNTLFLRDLPFVQQRLRDAPKVTVNGRQF